MNDMTMALSAIAETLKNCFADQIAAVATWHEAEPEEPALTGEPGLESLRRLVLVQHLRNFQLWHVEDAARRTDVSDAEIAACKRRVDSLNQKRNDCIEEVDRGLVNIMLPHLPPTAVDRHNTETVGMAVDRLSILALKMYHMEEQTQRPDADAGHHEACARKLGVLRGQREALIRSVLELIRDFADGNKKPLLYAQFKMYNDPNLNPELYGRRSAGA